MKGRNLAAIVAVVVFLAVGIAVAEVALTPGPATATVQFFSDNANGYACFINYTYNLTGGPVCLSDDPATDLPPNVTLPLGNYSIVFFPFGTASNRSLWLGTNNIQVTGSGAYDASSSYANITVKGDGALAVFVLSDNGQPIPEFPTTGAMVFSVVVASTFLLGRRRR
jgi:hypothetical protein